MCTLTFFGAEKNTADFRQPCFIAIFILLFFCNLFSQGERKFCQPDLRAC